MTTEQAAFEEKVNAMTDKAEVEGLEKRRVALERAARITELVESPAGVEFLSEIERLRDEYDLSPEFMFTPVDDHGRQQVDVALVARTAGARESLQAILNWVASCKVMLESEAAKNNRADSV